MNKLTMLLTGCAALGLAACSNEDLGNNPETPNEKPGDVAYLSVVIKDANSNGRADDAADPKYEYGSADEGKVATAKFLFYDENGVFMTESNIWDAGSTGDTENIEFKSKKMLVLQGLKDQDKYPKYMLTVLNAPDAFKEDVMYGYDIPMETTRKNLVKAIDNNLFVMTTTSYFGGETSQKNECDATKYYVNTLEREDFYEEPEELQTNDKPIEVYVERLAAKVTVTVAQDLEREYIEVNGERLYKMNVTVGGNENPDLNENTDPNTPATQEDTEDPSSAAGTVLYIKLAGWGLNGVVPQSLLSKNLTGWDMNTKIGSWEAGNDGLGWNHTAYHRSYWGKSAVYGDRTPELDYKKWNQLTSEYEKAAYCAENTNTRDIVFPTSGENTENRSLNSSAITSVLVKAIVCDKDGKGLDLVMYNGVMFNWDSYIRYELSSLNTAGKLNYYYYEKNDKDEDVYTQIGTDDVELVEFDSDPEKEVGYVKLRAKLKTGDIYKLVEEATEAVGDTPAKPAKYEKVDNAVETLNADFNKFSTDARAMAYKGGASYYTIPIEHLNAANKEAKEAQEEAVYGVVRNHSYKINITKLAHIGKGIFDPDVEIIKPDTELDPTYYMGATVNILSWKIVNQTAELN